MKAVTHDIERAVEIDTTIRASPKGSRKRKRLLRIGIWGCKLHTDDPSSRQNERPDCPEVV